MAPCVHTAQGRGVDSQFWFRTAVIGAGGGIEGVGIDVIAPGDDGQVLSLDLGVDLGAAGDDFEVIDVIRVQARAFNRDAALVHLIATQLAVFHHRFAGAQGHFRTVDEAAAVAGDAVGVGNDDMSRLPRHFGVAAQLTGVAAADFVEDGGGG